MLKLNLATLVICLAFGAPLAASAAPKYSITQLGEGEWRSINDHGLIGGSFGLRDALLKDGVISYTGVLAAPGEGYIYGAGVSAVSNSGAALVYTDGNYPPFERHTHLVKDGASIYMGELHQTYRGFTRMRQMNDKLEAVGSSSGPTGYRQGDEWVPDPRAVVYKDGKLHDLGTLGGDSSWATAINNASQIVGTSVDADRNYQLFLYENGAMHKLDVGVGNAASVAINDAGQIGGSYSKNGYSTAFTYANGVRTDLKLDGYANTIATDMNNHGQLIGGTEAYWTNSGHAFLYSDGSSYLLDQLIDPAAGWTIQTAHDINNNGQILVTGCKAGICSDLLLNPLAPVPEPATYGMLLVGLGGAGLLARRQRRANLV